MEYYFTEIDNFIMKIQILDYPEEIQEKVIYLLQDGKRLRPILCIIFSDLENSNLNNNQNHLDIFKVKTKTNLDLNNSNDETTKIIYRFASFIEQIHCLSLVLDDLPEMDNDSMRRGKDSFHSKFSSDYTNFFIYYMFNRLGLSLNSILDTYIYSNINDNLNPKNNSILNNNIKFANKIKQLLSSNLNILLDGQFNDLQSSFSKKPHKNSQENNLLDNKGARGAEALARESRGAEGSFSKKPHQNIDALTRELEGLKPSQQYINEIDIIIDFIEETGLEETDELSLAMIRNIDLNMKKTSSLFTLSICSGFLLQLWIKQYEFEKYTIIYEKLKIWSNILGYMFQISDDILDMEDDAVKDNPNICQIIGKENTSIVLKKGCGWLFVNIKKIVLECNTSLDNTNTYNCIHFNLDVIKEIIDKIVKRIET
jgi:geranylgeranyl pyrophosphate synthase